MLFLLYLYRTSVYKISEENASFLILWEMVLKVSFPCTVVIAHSFYRIKCFWCKMFTYYVVSNTVDCTLPSLSLNLIHQ